MEREPDREGYLDFCRRVDAGDHELAGKAELLSKDSRPDAVGQYHRMREIEGVIEHMSREDLGEVVHVYEMSDLHGLRDHRIRMDTLEKMSKAVEGWEIARAREAADYREVHKANDFRYATAERRAEHAHETEGQAWFQAKFRAQAAQLDRMIEQRKVLDRQLDGLSRTARGRDRGGRER